MVLCPRPRAACAVSPLDAPVWRRASTTRPRRGYSAKWRRSCGAATPCRPSPPGHNTWSRPWAMARLRSSWHLGTTRPDRRRIARCAQSKSPRASLAHLSRRSRCQPRGRGVSRQRGAKLMITPSLRLGFQSGRLALPPHGRRTPLRQTLPIPRSPAAATPRRAATRTRRRGDPTGSEAIALVIGDAAASLGRPSIAGMSAGSAVSPKGRGLQLTGGLAHLATDSTIQPAECA